MADDYDVEVAELHAIARHDQDAFSRWFARGERALRQSLRSYALFVDVEAVVQDTAIRVWERAATIMPDSRTGFLLRWAVTVARNNARNQLRRAGRLVRVDVDPEDEAATAIGRTDPMLRARIWRCRDELPANPRRALDTRLVDRGEHSDRELATSIGMTFDAFRQNLARGRRGLEQCLRKFGINAREYLT